MKHALRFFCAATVVSLSACQGKHATPESAEPTRAAEAPHGDDSRMAWWRDARFGMFIHWGLYAIPAGEWPPPVDGKSAPNAN